MQFAVVGDDVEAIFLVQAIGSSPASSLAMCCVTNDLATEMLNRGLTFELVDSAEEAIVDAATDTVIVACSDVDESMALCRQASQGGRHVVVIPPDEVSTAFSYELHLLLDESERGVIAFFGRWYVDRFVNTPGDTSEVRQLALQFPMIGEPRILKRAQMHGIDALAGCGYRFSRVTGLDVPGADGALLSRSITLAASEESGAQMPPAVVSFGTESSGIDNASIVVTKTDSSVTLRPTALPQPDAATQNGDSESLIALVCSELVDRDVCQRRMEEFSNTLELLTALEKSFRRRRTVDVYFDGVSERSAFKTQMTAIGCGIMSYVTFGLIALAMAQALGMPAPLLKLGMILWVGPVILFLLAQLLLPLARDRARPDKPSKDG